MLRFTLFVASALLLGLGTAAAEMPSVEDRARAPAPTLQPQSAGAALGARLAALGQLRPLGEDFDLTVRGLFTAEGADGFRRWRDLADTLGDAATALSDHRIVVVARAPHRGASAVDTAAQRASALTDALVARGVQPARITRLVAQSDPGGIELQIRFERIPSGFESGR